MNSISRIHEDVFHALVQTIYLYLSTNKLQVIKATHFSALTNLHMLSMASNEITTIENASLHLHSYLNELVVLRKSMFNSLNRLYYLYLDQYRITTIENGTFNGLFSLRHLSLHSNSLTAVPDLSETHVLSNLYLRLHPIQSITAKSIRQLRNVTDLDFARARVPNLPSFLNLRKLRTASLEAMGSNHTPHHVLKGIDTLTSVNLNMNKLVYFPDLGGSRYALTTLKLAKNRIYHIPNLEPYTRLSFLELSYTYIAMIPEGHHSHMRSESVKLCWNPIPCARQLCWLKRGDVSLKVEISPCRERNSLENIGRSYICEGR